MSEKWVIIYQGDTPFEFVRCHPNRAEEERKAWEDDGYTVVIEDGNPDPEAIDNRLKGLGL